MSEGRLIESRRPIRILLVEDNPGDADLVREQLDSGSEGAFQIAWAETLEAARAQLARGGFDVVLLDLSLTDSQGLYTFRAVHEQAPQVPIVILTGRDDEDVALQSLQEGGQDFLVKGQTTGWLMGRMLRHAVERKRAEQALLRSEDRYRILFETIPHPICVFAEPTRAFLAVNQAAVALYGYTKQEFQAMSLLDLFQPSDLNSVSSWLASKPHEACLRTRHRRKDGKVLDVEMTGEMVEFAGELAMFAIVTDVSERREAEQRLAYQASHDALTGLPNRTFLRSQVERMIAPRDAEDGTPFAFLLLDLDHFKEINDTLGHCYGDWVLQHLCPRLRGCVRRTDTVARLGGDEFAILLPAASAREASLIVEKVESALRAPFLVGGHSLAVGASVGISLYPEHGLDWDTLMQRADIAMYEAKRARCGHLFYSKEQSDDRIEQLVLTAELRKALENDELELHYQPKLDLETKQVNGVEALVRWRHPLRGFLPAKRIIALAEHAGLIRLLGHWVFAKAARQGIGWNRVGMDLEIAINLTAANLQDPKLVQEVIDYLSEREAHPLRLMLDLTESAMLADPERSKLILGRLHDSGVKISIDDFGTGYSSLAYLKELPVDEVKIDQSFVQGMANPRESSIVRSIIELGHNLGLRVVAEGVECAPVLERLTGLGCDVAQGYFLCHALPAPQLECWFKNASAADSWMPESSASTR
jgi:diguanylate cyclase (GGDEF)-like protein/PAS domain S-box-containing protein